MPEDMSAGAPPMFDPLPPMVPVGDDLESPRNIIGSAGDDTLNGDGNGDVILAQGGNDVIFGGAMHNAINGMAGDDTISAGGAGDLVLGGKGDDLMHGGAGNDVMNGNLGNDTADGGAGNDEIHGGQGDDSLSGGAGNDWLSGDKGDDTMAGGLGADTFNIFAGGGNDVITDFHTAEGDKVHVEGDVPFTVAQVGDDVVVTLAGHETLTLLHVNMNTLPDGWITH